MRRLCLRILHQSRFSCRLLGRQHRRFRSVRARRLRRLYLLPLVSHLLVSQLLVTLLLVNLLETFLRLPTMLLLHRPAAPSVDRGLELAKRQASALGGPLHVGKAAVC